MPPRNRKYNRDHQKLCLSILTNQILMCGLLKMFSSQKDTHRRQGECLRMTSRILMCRLLKMFSSQKDTHRHQGQCLKMMIHILMCRLLKMFSSQKDTHRHTGQYLNNLRRPDSPVNWTIETWHHSLVL